MLTVIVCLRCPLARFAPVTFFSIETGLLWELSPGPLAPEARIMPLDQAAMNHFGISAEYAGLGTRMIMRRNTLRSNALRGNALRGNVLRGNTLRANALRCTVLRGNTVQWEG